MSGQFAKYSIFGSGSGGASITTINGQAGPAITIVGGTGISVGSAANTITITNTVTDTGITQLTGDVTAGPGSGSQVATLATVNGNVGSFGSSTSIPSFTVNAKGLITAASGNAVIAPAGTLTGATLAAGVTGSSLTSVGTITSGTWNGTTIAIARGGTGQTTANTAFNALAPSQATHSGQFLTTDGTNTSWSAVSVTGFATTELDNLTTTAINTDLFPDTNDTWSIGSDTARWAVVCADDFSAFDQTSTVSVVYSGATVTLPSGASATGVMQGQTTAAIAIQTTNKGGAQPTGDIRIETGNQSASAVSGSIFLQTGTVSAGTRGSISVNALGIVANGVAFINASNQLKSTALTNGQILIGSTGAAPAAATITAGTGISVTNGANSITIASSVTPVTTLAAVGASPNANAATITGSTLNLQPADGTNPGVVTAGTQTFGGAKTFTGTVGTTSLLLNGATSGTFTQTVPAVVTSYSVTWPAAQGAAGTVPTNNGSGVLSWATPQQSYWSGYFDIAGAPVWDTSSTSFADPTLSSGTITLVQRQNSGMGTVTAASGSVAGITFTPASATAAYLVSITPMVGVTSGSAVTFGTRIWDGTTTITTAYSGSFFGATAVPISVPMIGVFVPGTASAVTISIQLENAGGSNIAIQNNYDTIINPVEFTIVRIA